MDEEHDVREVLALGGPADGKRFRLDVRREIFECREPLALGGVDERGVTKELAKNYTYLIREWRQDRRNSPFYESFYVMTLLDDPKSAMEYLIEGYKP